MAKRKKKMKILSRNRIRQLVNENPNELDCIIIYEPNQNMEINDILPLCKSYLELAFHDISSTREGYIEPKKEHVIKALEYAKNRKNLHVACRAGISRSSAIAYLIECQRTNPQEAIKILDSTKHMPNELLIHYGGQILGDEVVEPIREFYKNIDQFTAI